MSARRVSKIHLRLKLWSHMSSSRYSISCTKIRHRLLITYRDNLLRVDILIALGSEMCVKTQLKKHFNQLHQIQYINTKINVAACRLRWKYFTFCEVAPYHKQGPLWTVEIFKVNIKYAKLESNSLDASVFVTVFLQAKHVSATVLTYFSIATR